MIEADPTLQSGSTPGAPYAGSICSASIGQVLVCFTSHGEISRALDIPYPTAPCFFFVQSVRPVWGKTITLDYQLQVIEPSWIENRKTTCPVGQKKTRRSPKRRARHCFGTLERTVSPKSASRSRGCGWDAGPDLDPLERLRKPFNIEMDMMQAREWKHKSIPQDRQAVTSVGLPSDSDLLLFLTWHALNKSVAEGIVTRGAGQSNPPIALMALAAVRCLPSCPPELSHSREFLHNSHTRQRRAVSRNAEHSPSSTVFYPVTVEVDRAASCAPILCPARLPASTSGLVSLALSHLCSAADEHRCSAVCWDLSATRCSEFAPAQKTGQRLEVGLVVGAVLSPTRQQISDSASGRLFSGFAPVKGVMNKSQSSHPLGIVFAMVETVLNFPVDEVSRGNRAERLSASARLICCHGCGRGYCLATRKPAAKLLEGRWCSILFEAYSASQRGSPGRWMFDSAACIGWSVHGALADSRYWTATELQEVLRTP
ncbi:hypothetical protein C8F01DRAFT_1235164 [Mycena amicta]|nr:hypothetical protein C8F01DRAFT_1235164 [Mycena amicta]